MEFNYTQSAPGFKLLADELEGIAACDININIDANPAIAIEARATAPAAAHPAVIFEGTGPIVVSPAIDAVNKHIVVALDKTSVAKANDHWKVDRPAMLLRKHEPQSKWLPELDLFDSTAS